MERPACKTLSAMVARIAEECVVRAARIGHRTVWATGEDIVRINAQPVPLLVFITFDPVTAVKAREALTAAGVFCDTDLGMLTAEEREAWISE